MNGLLEIQDFSVSYFDTPIVQSVSLTLQEGEIAGLVGESGCGKSTFLRSVMRLTDSGAQITGGSILFCGNDVMDHTEEQLRQLRGAQISMVFQDSGQACNPVKKVGYQFREAMNSHGKKVSKAECYERAGILLKALRLHQPERVLNSYPFELSGGMNQRVGLALAMINNPKLLLADEPTSALDVTVQMQVIHALKELRDQYHTAMLVVTHSIGVVAQLCDTVGVMYAGRIVEWGSCEEVLSSPSHPYTEALIAAVPNTDGTAPKAIPGMPPDFAHPLPGCAFAPRCPYAEPECTQELPQPQSLSPSHWTLCRHGRKGG